VHYSSERIRRDAPTQLTDFASKFSLLCSSLVASRREDALKLAQQLLVMSEAKKVVEDTVLEQRGLLDRQSALIAHYEGLLGSAPVLT
jgi:hypothetical protein